MNDHTVEVVNVGGLGLLNGGKVGVFFYSLAIFLVQLGTHKLVQSEGLWVLNDLAILSPEAVASEVNHKHIRR